MPLSPPSRERQGGVNRVPQALQACILVLTQLASTRLPGRSKPRPYVIFSGEVLLPLTPYLSPLTSYLLPLHSYLLPLHVKNGKYTTFDLYFANSCFIFADETQKYN